MSSRVLLHIGYGTFALASRAVDLTAGRDVAALDALAAAQAETGRFAEAITTARRATEQAAAQGRETQAKAIGERLASYQRGEPFRTPR